MRQDQDLWSGDTNDVSGEYRPILPGIQQPRRPGEGVSTPGCGGLDQCASAVSGGQALASLGPATVDHQAPVLGRHAGAKTVVALALQDTGLKGSFHEFYPLSREWGENERGF